MPDTSPITETRPIPEKGYWHQALTYILPVAMGYVPAGIAFGVLFVAAGLPAWAAIFSSIILYAGAAQYASIPLLASGAGIFTLMSNTAAINLRHVFYAIPLLHQLPSSSVKRLYCLFALTDETFSVLTTLHTNIRQKYMFAICVLCQSFWVIGTILGVLVGTKLNNLVPHLDFALVCLFAILGYEQFKAIRRIYPIVIALMAFMLAMVFLPTWRLLTAIAISIVIIIAHFNWLDKSSNLLDQQDAQS